jgi:subtilisin family serine protease
MTASKVYRTDFLTAVVTLSISLITWSALPGYADDNVWSQPKRTLQSVPMRLMTATKDNSPICTRGRSAAKRSKLVSQELLVRFDDQAPKESRKRLLGRRGVIAEMWSARSGHAVLRLPKGWPASDAQAWFAAQDIVALAEPNFIYTTQEYSNDVRLADQWALARIDAQAAWNLETGSPDIVIAIIDTGVNYGHVDLAANIWKNPGELSGDGLDNDGNGFVDDDIGWDFVSNAGDCDDADCSQRDRDPMDGHGHGTHVAGISAAVTDNGIGIAGVTWGCRIMAVRVGYKDAAGRGVMQLKDAVDGIYYAVDNGADILNLSWGSTHNSELLQDAIAYASERGVVVCAAAGNENAETYFYPAACGGSLVLAVGATDQKDDKASYSSFGNWVHVSAPGSSILSTCVSGNYCSKSGTSMAAPHVAGMAGLLLSRFPGWSAEFIMAMLLNSVVVLSDLEGINVTSGIVNLAAAVEVDDGDLALFAEHIAQSFGTVACIAEDTCEGDSDGDLDVDGFDLTSFLDL